MEMGTKYLGFPAVYTAISFVGLSWSVNLALNTTASDDSVTKGSGFWAYETTRLFEVLLGSYFTVVLLANFILSLFVTTVLCLQILFFGPLSLAETRKAVEHLINYIVHKGAYLPLVINADIYQAAFWLSWFMVVCTLKLFEGLTKERLERLNASPLTTPWSYFRVYSVLLFILTVDFFWIRLCTIVYKASESTSFLLLLYEPLGIIFETLQGIIVYGSQLIDTWNRHFVEENVDCRGIQLFNSFSSGSSQEWRGSLIRNSGFLLDVLTILMAMAHYLHIWWLHGLSFHVVDAVLFLNLKALVGALIKRLKGFIKLRAALNTLQKALPDATVEELKAYNDECAICKEAMTSAKKLCCNHFFHLSCLRAWLDQGLTDGYSCPTCRRPVVMTTPLLVDNLGTVNRQIVDDERLARRMSSEIDHSSPGHNIAASTVPNQQLRHGDNFWRMSLDSGWLQTWPNMGHEGAGPSNPAFRSVGFSRVQMMMRQLAAVSGAYSQNTVDDSAWDLWPMNQPHPTAGSALSPSPPAAQFAGNVSNVRLGNTSPFIAGNMSNILAMAETVREVLPQIPDEIILQDLQRTNSVSITVNNLLHL